MNIIILIVIVLIAFILLIALFKTIKSKNNDQYAYKHRVMKKDGNKRKLCTETVRVDSFMTAFLLNIFDMITYIFILI